MSTLSHTRYTGWQGLLVVDHAGMIIKHIESMTMNGSLQHNNEDLPVGQCFYNTNGISVSSISVPLLCSARGYRYI